MRPEEIGALIQAYVREKSRPATGDEPALSEVAAALEPKLRSRIDALGFDGEFLLKVSPADVVQRIESLEVQAQREDARAAAAAHRNGPQEPARSGPFRAPRPPGQAGRGKRMQGGAPNHRSRPR